MSENLPAAGFYANNNIKNLFKTTINHLLADLGRTVYLYLQPIASGCPNCFAGPDGSSNGIYNASNPYPLGQYNKPFKGTCFVCKGSHKILTENKVHYKANINWSPKDVNYDELGVAPEDVVKTKMQICAFDDLNQCVKSVIDGVICVKIREPIKTGLKDLAFVRTYWKKIN